jgi:SAM-dependent methyltransferase
MPDRGLFDRYASCYTDAVDAAITASGENSGFFARLKADRVRRTPGIAAPRRILDFGCGVGGSTRALAETFPTATVIGCDESPESVRVARNASPLAHDRVLLLVQGPPGLPLRDSSVDVAFASCVFHHIAAPAQLGWIKEVRRVLRPGAAFFLFEHNPYNPLTRRVVNAIPFDAGVTLLRPAYAAGLMRSAGLRVDRPRYYFFFPHILRRLRRMDPYLDWLPIGGQYYVVGWREG